MKEKLKEIIEGYKKAGKTGFNLIRLDCAKEKGQSFKILKETLKQDSMFKEKKLVVAENSLADESFAENFIKEKYFETSDDIIILCQEGRVKKSAFVKFLEKKAKSQKFDFLSGQKLKDWVRKEFSGYGSKITPEAENLLIIFCGSDLWRLSGEINKLVFYKNKNQATEEDVRLLIRSNVEADIFKTIDAIGQKDKKLALDCIKKHLEKGDSSLYIFSMINYQFRNLILAKSFGSFSPELARASGMHPYVAKKASYQAFQFTWQELKKIYQKLFSLDLRIKTGEIASDSAIEIFISEI